MALPIQRSIEWRIGLVRGAWCLGILAALALPDSARAFTVSGTVAMPGAGNVGGALVEVWAVTPPPAKSEHTYTGCSALSAAVTGAYSIPCAATVGRYRLHVRPALNAPADPNTPRVDMVSFAQDWVLDQWFGAGGVGADTASGVPVITLAAAGAATVGITLQPGYGLRGRLTSDAGFAVPLAGLWLQAEDVTSATALADPDHAGVRITGPTLAPTEYYQSVPPPTDPGGWFYFRGIRSDVAYRLVVYDPLAVYDTFVLSDGVTYGSRPSATAPVSTQVTMPMAIDPYDAAAANQTPATGTPLASLTETTPGVWETSLAVIGPGDVDFYCLDAADGDHFQVAAVAPVYVSSAAETPYTVASQVIINRFVDPVLGLYDATPTQLKVDDDSGARLHAALLDMGDLVAGHYCIGVSTGGDSTFTGVGQVTTLVNRAGTAVSVPSVGRYHLMVARANRRPSFQVRASGTAAKFDGADCTSALPCGLPATLISYPVGAASPKLATVALPLLVVRDSTVTLTISNAVDPDGDPLSYEVVHDDRAAIPVTDGVFCTPATVPACDPPTYTYTAQGNAARYSPHRVLFKVTDTPVAPPSLYGSPFPAVPYSMWIEVTLQILSTNAPPSVPKLAGPFASATSGVVFTQEIPAGFEVLAATDPEGQPIWLELQILPHGGSQPLLDVQQPQVVPSTLMMFAGASLIENGRYDVRVRAFDGESYSPWSTSADFLVNLVNTAPDLSSFGALANNATVKADTTGTVPTVSINVSNVSDPDGTPVEIAYCMTTDVTCGDCSPDPNDWDVVLQGSEASGTYTALVLAADQGQSYCIETANCDSQGACSTVQSVRFSVEAAPAGPKVVPPSPMAYAKGCCSAHEASRAETLLMGALLLIVFVRRRRAAPRS